MSRPLRVLHAPIVALYQPWLFVKGLREAGCNADYMVFNVANNERWLMHDVDINLCLDTFHGMVREKTVEFDFLLYAIENYDVFHFHSGCGLLKDDWSLFRRCSDLRLLKKLGKKIVMHWWGCDRRTEDVDAHYEYSACHECCEETKTFCRSAEKRATYEWIDKYADVQLSNGDICASIPHIKWMNNAIDTDLWRPLERDEIPEKFRLPESGNIRIYHSFGNSESRGDVKGSREIKAAVERLIDEGYPLDFMFFDKVPNLELRYYQAQADVVIDQLRSGWHGSTCVECLACGKPVITYIRPEVEKIVPVNHPIINATLETIYDVLKRLFDNPKEISRIGKESRKYAVEEHSYLQISERLLSVYEEL